MGGGGVTGWVEEEGERGGWGEGGLPGGVEGRG